MNNYCLRTIDVIKDEMYTINPERYFYFVNFLMGRILKNHPDIHGDYLYDLALIFIRHKDAFLICEPEHLEIIFLDSGKIFEYNGFGCKQKEREG